MQILKNELINEIKERSSYLKQTHLYRGLNNKSIDELRFYIYELRQTKSIKENWENRFNVDQEGPTDLHEVWLDGER